MERNNINFKDIARHPLVYALVILGGLVGFFVNQNSDISSRSYDDCREELRVTKLELQSLYRQLLIKQGVIDALPKTTDSLAKNNLK